MVEYLAIADWAKEQTLRGPGAWIKDSTSQGDRPELAKLSFFQRGVYQELRRYRGRTGKNILYDLEFIAGATHATPTDRSHLGHALVTLISRRILVLTNQEVDFARAGESKSKREIESNKQTKPSSARKARGTHDPINDPCDDPECQGKNPFLEYDPDLAAELLLSLSRDGRALAPW